MSLQAGDRIERYVIIELLGTGGMGEVYKARDERLQRVVALKVLRPDPQSLRDPSQPQAKTDGGARMKREAQAAAKLEHPNVITVFDVGEVNEPEALRGTTYIAMDDAGLVRGIERLGDLCRAGQRVLER